MNLLRKIYLPLLLVIFVSPAEASLGGKVLFGLHTVVLDNGERITRRNPTVAKGIHYIFYKKDKATITINKNWGVVRMRWGDANFASCSLYKKTCTTNLGAGDLGSKNVAIDDLDPRMQEAFQQLKTSRKAGKND